MALEKWEASGLLINLSSENKEKFSMVLENLTNLLSDRISNNVYTRDEGSKIATFIFPIAAKIFRDGIIKNVESLIDFVNLNLKTGALDSLKELGATNLNAEIEFIGDVVKEYIKLNK